MSVVRIPTTWRSVRGSALVLLTAPVALAGCGVLEEAPAAGATTVDVVSGDGTCEVAQTELTAGPTVFALSNDGAEVTEVYVLDGETILSEKENIAPGTDYELTVDLAEGRYDIACVPGMRGDGIRQAVTVAAAGTEAEMDPLAEQAVTDYRTWVQGEADALVPLVEEFAAAIDAGDVEAAKALYAPSREPWERIEPVAESFGDLDPMVDLREADLEPGQEWTGWHVVEKALWETGDLTDMTPVADQLVADVKDLQSRVPDAAMSVTSIGNGAKELLDEVATGKVTGEEEAFSHTDLVDFAANIEGARQALEVLRPLVSGGDDPELLGTLDTAFAEVDAALVEYQTADGYVSYDTVDEAGRRELARVVDGLSEPLSRLTAAAVR